MKSVCFALLATGVAAITGDDIPNPLAVLNVGIEEPAYGYLEAQRAAMYKDNEAKLAQLEKMSAAAKAHMANAIRSSAAKLDKAAHMSFLEETAGPALDAEAREKIVSQLSADCGQECVDFFHKLEGAMSQYNTQNGKKSDEWQGALVNLMKQEHGRVSSLYKDTVETSKLASMLQKRKALTRWNPIDTPCPDAATCKIFEVVANACNYGRVSTLATYNAVNLAVHVFGVVVDVLCGCIHVASTGMCILKDAPIIGPPLCQFPYSVFNGLFKASKQVWTAVQGSTKMCTMHGDARVLP